MREQKLITDFDTFVTLAEAMVAGDGVQVIGVGGWSGAGKTTLCNRLVSALPNRAFHLSCDSFASLSYPDRQKRFAKVKASGDAVRLMAEENPLNWYDWAGISKAIQELRTKRSFRSDRMWNRENGLLDASYLIELPPEGAALVLCDGIFLCHEPVRSWFDLTFHVDASPEIIHARARIRARDDIALRGVYARRDKFERPYFEACAERADCRVLMPA